LHSLENATRVNSQNRQQNLIFNKISKNILQQYQDRVSNVFMSRDTVHYIGDIELCVLEGTDLDLSFIITE